MPDLASGQLEAVSDEFALFHIEFAHHRGVGAATRQFDQGQGVVGFDDFGARPHPVRIVNARQFIDVDDDVPLGRLGAVAGQRRAPPQPARVLRVAPEVVQVVAAAPHIRDAGVGVENLQRFEAHLLEPIAGPARSRVGSLCLRTQSSASSPVMSSSHRYGSSSTDPFLPGGSVARPQASHQGADEEHQHGRRDQRADPLQGRVPRVMHQIEGLGLRNRPSAGLRFGFRDSDGESLR